MANVRQLDIQTVNYAQVWSNERFQLEANSKWWPKAGLLCEDKGDELGIGAVYKIDVPGPCWLLWEGTTAEYRIMQVVYAGETIDSPPNRQFLPVRPGVNVLSFENGSEPEPEPDPEPGPDPEPEPEPDPEPEPEPEPFPPVEQGLPRYITFYGGDPRISRPFVTRWGDWELVIVVPQDMFTDFYEAFRDFVKRVQDACE